MKIDDQMRFPHPVLWTRTRDFVSGDFAVSLNIEETPGSGHLDLSYTVLLDEPAIAHLLDIRHAAIGLFVTCLETYYNSLVPISHAGGRTEIQAGLLKGRVVIRPVIWAVERIPDFHSANLHQEFGAGALDLPQGAILALTDEIVISVGLEKLQRMESIFALSLNDNVLPDQIMVQLDEDKIRIVASRVTGEKIHTLRGTADGRALLLNAVYLPAVMEVLAYLKDDSAQYDGRKWHRVLTAKMDHLGIRADRDGHLENAQKLLNSPLGRISGHPDLRAS